MSGGSAGGGSTAGGGGGGGGGGTDSATGTVGATVGLGAPDAKGLLQASSPVE